jgi:hypothetical protein
MSDEFEDFIQRLEMPMPEPKIVGVVDKAMDVQMACMGLACTYIRHTMLMPVSTQVSHRGKGNRGQV